MKLVLFCFVLFTFVWCMTQYSNDWSMFRYPVEEDFCFFLLVLFFKFCFYKEWFFFCRSFRALVLQNSLNFQVKLSSKCNLRQIRMEGGNLNCNIEGKKESRGALIVLEGLDRSGKSSQCSRLASYLEGQGLSAELWRFPDKTTNVGQMISAYLTNSSQLDDHTIHLLFSANRWEKRFVLLFLVP